MARRPARPSVQRRRPNGDRPRAVDRGGLQTPSPNRMPLFIGVGVLGAVVVAVALFLLLGERKPASKKPAGPPSATGPVATKSPTTSSAASPSKSSVKPATTSASAPAIPTSGGDGSVVHKTADPGGDPQKGLRAVGRIYAGWAYSQPWIKRHGWEAATNRETFGAFEDVGAWLEGYWDKLFMARHAGDIAACARTWIAHDVADGGDLATALGRITARTHVMTTTTDLYFTPADCRAEAGMIRGATYADIDSDWGHMAGSGQSEADTAVMDAAIARMLAD